MIKNEKYDELGLMYELFSKVPDAFQSLTRNLSAYIVSEGQTLMRESGLKHDQFVASVIALREKMMSIHVKSFAKDTNIDLAVKNAFEAFLNTDSEKTAMSLVYYLDDQFKKDFKQLAEGDVNDRLERVIKIFRYLQDKDVFEGFYKVSLSKRLLDTRGPGGIITLEDAEKLLVLKLKEECGFQFTQKLEVMFRDIKMSEDTMNDFRGTTSLFKQLNCELSVKVLTTGNWPNDPQDFKDILAVLPKEITFCTSVFNKFYNNKHTGRLLHWKPNLGYADVKACLGESKHELQTSTYQMMILMLYNQANALTFQQLLQLTNIADMEMKCNLIPFLQLKILLKSNPANPAQSVKEFHASDVYTLNTAFKHQMYKIKVPIAHAKDNKSMEKIDIADKVEEDRRHIVEATIVKIMKARRKIEHNALIAEATKILSQKFCPDPIMIKKRIEQLIEREYMERDAEDRRFYKYIA